MFDQYVLPESGYIPEYQGIPLAQIESSAQRLDDLYYKNLASANQLDILNAERQAITGDRGLNQQVSQEYAGMIDELAKTGDYENMSPRLAAMARQYVRDPRIKAIQQSHKNYEQERDLAQKLRAQGKTAVFTGDPSKHVSYDPNTGESNIYTSGMESMLDYDTRRANIWKELNPDQFITGLTDKEKDLFGQELNYFIKYGQTRGILDSKIEENLKHVLSAYQSTPEFKQEMRYLQWTGEAPDAETAAQMIREKTLSRGKLREYSQRDIALSSMPAAAFKTSEGAPTNYEEMSAMWKQSEVGYDPNKFKERDRRRREPSEGTPRYPYDRREKSYFGRAEGISEEEEKAYNQGVQAGIEIFAPPGTDPESLSAEEKNQYSIKYADYVAERMFNYNINSTDFNREKAEGNLQPTSTTSEELQRDVEANVQRQAMFRSYMDLATGEVFTPQDGEKFTSKFAEYIGDPANMSVSGTIDPKHFLATKNPAFVDAYAVTVTDPEEGTSRVLLQARGAGSRNKAFHARAKAINEMYTTFNETPNQERTMYLLGKEIKGKKVVGVGPDGTTYDKGYELSIDGSEPFTVPARAGMGLEDMIVDTIINAEIQKASR